jgi:two-component system, cell cycle response regulator
MDVSHARVVVAEDSRLQRAVCVDILRAEGVEVHEAPDGRVTLDLCRIVRPDLLILDLDLPRLTGKEVLARLRADRRIGATPVLVLTADERDATVADMLDAGATDFLAKPARPAELLARVRRVLRDKANVEQLVERNRVLGEAARIDALTGLPNRRASAEALVVAATRARDSGLPLAVALVDIDRFKSINDTYGHTAGDHVLCALAGRLSDRAGANGTVGRWGGEEFIAVLPDAGPDLAAVAAEALRDASAGHSVDLGGNPLFVTVSVGWASSSEATPDQLIELADAALYAAKADGRNCVRASAVTI